MVAANAILHKGASPVPKLKEDLRILKQAGADFTVMPCNMVPYFIKDLRVAEILPVVDMIDETIISLGKNILQFVGWGF